MTSDIFERASDRDIKNNAKIALWHKLWTHNKQFNTHKYFVFALLMFRPNVTEHGWWSVRITDCRYCDPMQIRVRSRSANQRTVMGWVDQSEPRKCSPGDISDERHILSILAPSSLGLLVADEVSSGRFSRISPGVRTSLKWCTLTSQTCPVSNKRGFKERERSLTLSDQHCHDTEQQRKWLSNSIYLSRRIIQFEHLQEN